MGKVRILDLSSARQISNPTGPAMGEHIGAAVKDLGQLLADEFVLPPDKGRFYSSYWRMITFGDGSMHFTDIRFKPPHWYSLSKTVVTLMGRDWEDSVFIDARCLELLGPIKRAADKFVTLPGTPDVNIYAFGWVIPPQYVQAGNNRRATA